MPHAQIVINVPTRAVYPGLADDTETIQELLGQLDAGDAALLCTRLNLVVSGPPFDKSRLIQNGSEPCSTIIVPGKDIDELARQEHCVHMCFTKEETKKINSFAREHGDCRRIRVFFRGQLLEMLRWILLFSPENIETSYRNGQEEFRVRFCQAALISSSLISQRVYSHPVWSSPEKPLSDDEKVSVLGSIRKGVEATEVASFPLISLGRGSMLFSAYMPQYSPGFSTTFEEDTGLSLRSYYSCLTPVLCVFSDPRGTGDVFDTSTLGVGTPLAGDFSRFVSLESQTLSELRTALGSDPDTPAPTDYYDYAPLRSRPILRYRDSLAIALDPIFMTEKASVGPLFHIRREDRADAMGHYGLAFEAYACDVLEGMFPDLLSGPRQRFRRSVEIAPGPNTSGQVDAWVNNVRTLVLFEMKAVFLREDSILNESPNDYLAQMRAKYVWGSDGDGIGVEQLARTIRLMASRSWLGTDRELEDVRVVYPVLLVHDTSMSAPLHSRFLDQEFRVQLNPEWRGSSGRLRIEQLDIMPLTIMTVDDLEILEGSVSNFPLGELLQQYATDCPDRVVSLHDYLALSRFKDKLCLRTRALDIGLELLEQSQAELFPKDST